MLPRSDDRCRRPRGRGVLLLLGLCVFAFAFQGSRGIWERDEGRYTNVAVQMLRYDDWLRPQLHPDRPHFTKPPLTYWAVAAGVQLLGYNEWAARAPIAVAFVLTTLLVYGIGRKLVPGQAWLPALVYATSPLPYAAANIITTDTFLALWEALAVFGFVHLWWREPARPGRGWAVVMWTGLGMAFLTKGPPGLIPLLPILVFACGTRRWAGLRPLVSLPGLLSFAVCGFGWYIVLVKEQPSLLHYLLADEVVGRLAGMHNRNTQWYQGFKVYVPMLLLGALPWAALTARRMPQGIRFLCRVHCRATWLESGEDSFLALWLLLPLAVFFLVPSRLPLYILPVFVPLALLLARQLGGIRWHLSSRIALVAGWVVLLIAGKGMASRVPLPHRDARAMARAIRQSVQFEPAEILFVGSPAWYGLGLYFPSAGLERVRLRAGEPEDQRQPHYETLREELAERRMPALYIVAAESVESFRRGAMRMARRMEKLGTYREFVFVRLRRW